MGHMMNGKWVDDDRITADVRGAFVRADSQFRSWVTADGNAGPSGSGGFKAEPGRYHLFVSYNCPWAHRTIIFRKLKKLENVVSMSLADKPKTAGWAYSETIDDFQPEKDGVFRLHQVYAAADANYTGKVTVPTLWDRERRTIVNNESSEIIRMFNSGFRAHTECNLRFLPGRAARRNRSDQRFRLWPFQQRRVPGWLCAQPGSLRRSSEESFCLPGSDGTVAQ